MERFYIYLIEYCVPWFYIFNRVLCSVVIIYLIVFCHSSLAVTFNNEAHFIIVSLFIELVHSFFFGDRLLVTNVLLSLLSPAHNIAH